MTPTYLVDFALVLTENGLVSLENGDYSKAFYDFDDAIWFLRSIEITL